mgnify:CR=1 FL=1
MRIFPDLLEDKTPGEEFNKAQEFTDEIPTSDSIRAVGGMSGTTVVAEDQGGTDVSSSVVVSKAVSGTTLKAYLKMPTGENTYLVTYTAQMANSQELFKKYLIVRVRTPKAI